MKLLGKRRSLRLLSDVVRGQTSRLPPITFPVDCGAAKKVLIILPPGRLQVLHQMKNAAALIALFGKARVTLCAEARTGPLAAMIGAAEIVEYRAEEKQLFTAQWSALAKRFHGAFDVCCLLVRAPDLPLLYLTGRTAAPLRIGYAAAGEYPFLCMRINPSPDLHYLTESNCAMAETLGGKRKRERRWSVAEETAAEIDHLLLESRLPAGVPLIGIDAVSLGRGFGVAWAEACIEAVRSAAPGAAFYLYGDERVDPERAKRFGRFHDPLIAELTVPQTGALLRRTTVAIAGNSLYFGLAAHIGIKSVGIFQGMEIAFYCPEEPGIKGIAFAAQAPDSGVIDRVAAAVKELLKK